MSQSYRHNNEDELFEFEEPYTSSNFNIPAVREMYDEIERMRRDENRGDISVETTNRMYLKKFGSFNYESPHDPKMYTELETHLESNLGFGQTTHYDDYYLDIHQYENVENDDSQEMTVSIRRWGFQNFYEYQYGH